ncbi:MAG: DoxX family protein [Emcibacter sp.]|nr:DoxX family protein [Emcibacter sp.]
MDGERLVKFIIWVLSLVLAIVFFYNGISKIAETSSQTEQFEALGISSNVMRLVGIFECLGALMLTLPRLALFGGGILGSIMLVSAGLHFFHGNMMSSFRASVIILMLVSICYLRYKYRDTAIEDEQS